MKLLVLLPLLILLQVFWLTQGADAGFMSNSKKVDKTDKKAVSSILHRDKVRDMATTPKPLEKDTKVRRFVRNKKDLQKDIPANSHTTAPIRPGRFPSAERAQKQYGLPEKPRYVGVIDLEKKRLERRNKVVGGEPGRGEMTSPQKVNKNQVEKIVKLR